MSLNAYQSHDHQQCVVKAMNLARSRCRANGARLTRLRELVLELVWQSHQPAGAYQIMDMLRERYPGNVAPPTVYRSLEFLQEQGLVHRLASLNAYIGCNQPQQHQPSFFICKSCHNALEVNTPRIAQAIREIASTHQFAPATSREESGTVVEVVGLCGPCSRQSRPRPDTSPRA